jgi:hypothetical protein
MTVLKCLLVLVAAYLFLVGVSGLGVAAGGLEVLLLFLGALLVMAVIVRRDRRRA